MHGKDVFIRWPTLLAEYGTYHGCYVVGSLHLALYLSAVLCVRFSCVAFLFLQSDYRRIDFVFCLGDATARPEC